MKHLFTTLLIAAFALTSCDIPSAEFESNYFQFDNRAGTYTIEVESTGLDKLILDFEGEKPWLKVIDIDYESENIGSYPDEAEIITKALPVFDDKIKIEIEANTTGAPRAMTITSVSFGVQDVAVIIQEK